MIKIFINWNIVTMYRYNYHDYTSLLSRSAFALVSKESVCSYKMRGNLIWILHWKQIRNAQTEEWKINEWSSFHAHTRTYAPPRIKDQLALAQ